MINRAGKGEIIKSRHFVLAVGGGGQVPEMPNLPGRENFKGIAMHSASYKNASEFKDKKAVIVGTGKTTHDVAEDMVRAGCTSTTMIQRGRTFMFPVEYYRKWADPIYNPARSLESILRAQSTHGTRVLASQQPERFDSLERAGFRVERYGDLWKLLSGRFGGFYQDVGASAKISAGSVCTVHDTVFSQSLTSTDQGERRCCFNSVHS